MLISEIIPYDRNARHNERAIPAVADSIREFGLRGTIGLESRERPVIVFGHTRVAACKSLGWDEIPDDKIEFCDDLTEDQIKAFRIADNKTGDIATYNKAMLREEVRGIKGVDMSRFGCDFKSKLLPYGAEKFKTDYAYNLHLVDIDECSGEYEYPSMYSVDVKPDDLIPFNFCKSATSFDAGVHFCIDDYQFERVWNSPERYLDLLKRFQCVVCPDFSVYLNMPYPMKLWNIYRSRALGNYWQRNGITVVPNVTWSGEDSIEYCLDGIPVGGTVFISTVGVQADEYEGIVLKGMDEVVRRIRPTRVLMLGKSFGHDFGGAEIVRYKTKAFRGAANGKG